MVSVYRRCRQCKMLVCASMLPMMTRTVFPAPALFPISDRTTGMKLLKPKEHFKKLHYAWHPRRNLMSEYTWQASSGGAMSAQLLMGPMGVSAWQVRELGDIPPRLLRWPPPRFPWQPLLQCSPPSPETLLGPSTAPCKAQWLVCTRARSPHAPLCSPPPVPKRMVTAAEPLDERISASKSIRKTASVRALATRDMMIRNGQRPKAGKQHALECLPL